MLNSLRDVTCNSCGWVYVAVSLDYATDQITKFNKFFSTLPKEVQINLYGGNGASLKEYLHCWCGNSYKNFRDFKPGDCPDGCTIGPILDRDENSVKVFLENADKLTNKGVIE